MPKRRKFLAKKNENIIKGSFFPQILQGLFLGFFKTGIAKPLVPEQRFSQQWKTIRAQRTAFSSYCPLLKKKGLTSTPWISGRKKRAIPQTSPNRPVSICDTRHSTTGTRHTVRPNYNSQKKNGFLSFSNILAPACVFNSDWKGFLLRLRDDHCQKVPFEAAKTGTAWAPQSRSEGRINKTVKFPLNYFFHLDHIFTMCNHDIIYCCSWYWYFTDLNCLFYLIRVRKQAGDFGSLLNLPNRLIFY